MAVAPEVKVMNSVEDNDVPAAVKAIKWIRASKLDTLHKGALESSLLQRIWGSDEIKELEQKLEELA